MYSVTTVSIRAALAGGDFSTSGIHQHATSFNPRRPCGRRPFHLYTTELLSCFNPRRPCGRRQSAIACSLAPATFQSAPPLRAATIQFRPALECGEVSIRAALAGGDLAALQSALNSLCFNPRRPCGRRRGVSNCHHGNNLFQSAPPLRAATNGPKATTHGNPVSIRAALAGGDHASVGIKDLMMRFNPRRPCGRRLPTFD